MSEGVFEGAVASLAMRRFVTRVPRFKREFARAVRQYTEEAAAHGIVRSGAFIHGMQERCMEEIARRVDAAQDALTTLLEAGSWAASPGEALRVFEDALAAIPKVERLDDDIAEALRNAIAIVGPLGTTNTAPLFDALRTVQNERIEEARSEIEAVVVNAHARRSAPAVFHGPVSSVQIGNENTTLHGARSEERQASTGAGRDVPPDIAKVIAEDPAGQLAREQRGEPPVLRQHLEVLLDPTRTGVIIREAEDPPQEPEQRPPALRREEYDPMGRILLSNVGHSTVVRLWLTMPVQILNAPATHEGPAYKPGEVIQASILVRVLRPGSIMLTITNRLASPLIVGLRPEADEEVDVTTSDGWETVKRRITIQTLYLARIRGSERAR